MTDHALDALRYAPDAAFGRFAVRTVDVAATELAPDSAGWIAGTLGPCRVVVSRVGWR